MRRFTKMALAIATVIGSVGIGSGVAVAATPDTPNCTFGSSSGNVKTCVNILSGPEVSATAVIVPSGQGRTLLVCVESPSGHRFACSNGGNYMPVNPGKGVDILFPDPGSAPAGTYCAVTRRQNADGTPTVIGRACKST